MPTPKALRTRQTLLTVARTIILNEGIGALTMDKVAEAAGVSKGACMYHFRSKRALQAALLEDYAEHLNTELERHEAMLSGSKVLMRPTTGGRGSGWRSYPIFRTMRNSCSPCGIGTRTCMPASMRFRTIAGRRRSLPSWRWKGFSIRISSA